MRWHEKTLAILIVLTLVMSACRGSSDDVAAVTPEPNVETPTVVEEPQPTATPEAVIAPVTEQDRIDAVVGAFDAAIAEGEGPEGLIAYDVLDSAVDEEGLVTLNICGWTGDSVFDSVRDSLWRTSVEADGAVTASHVTTPIASGECLNSQLIESALATVEEFDAFWTEVEAEPELFQTDPRTDLLLDQGLRDFSASILAGYQADDVRVLNSRRSGPVFEDLPAQVLWRRYTQNGESVIELAICRDMDPLRGLYRGDVLFDDGKGEEPPGPHSIDAIQLQPDPANPALWKVSGREALIWADCVQVDDWPTAASEWRKGSVKFRALER